MKCLSGSMLDQVDYSKEYLEKYARNLALINGGLLFQTVRGETSDPWYDVNIVSDQAEDYQLQAKGIIAKKITEKYAHVFGYDAFYPKEEDL